MMTRVCIVTDLPRDAETGKLYEVGETGYVNAQWDIPQHIRWRSDAMDDGLLYDAGLTLSSPEGKPLSLPIVKVVSLDEHRSRPIITERLCFDTKHGLAPFHLRTIQQHPKHPHFVAVDLITHHQNLQEIHRSMQGLGQEYTLIDPRRLFISELMDKVSRSSQIFFDVTTEDRIRSLANVVNDDRRFETLSKSSAHHYPVQGDFATISRAIFSHGDDFDPLSTKKVFGPSNNRLDDIANRHASGPVNYSVWHDRVSQYHPFDLTTGVRPIQLVSEKTQVHPTGYLSVVDILSNSVITDAHVRYISLNGYILPDRSEHVVWHSRYGSVLHADSSVQKDIYHRAAQVFFSLTIEIAKVRNDNEYLQKILTGAIVTIRRSYTEELLLEVYDSEGKELLWSVYLDMAASTLAPASVTAI